MLGPANEYKYLSVCISSSDYERKKYGESVWGLTGKCGKTEGMQV